MKLVAPRASHRRADVSDREHELADSVLVRPEKPSSMPGVGGPDHHVALGIGHQLSRVRKVADLLGLELAVVGDTA